MEGHSHVATGGVAAVGLMSRRFYVYWAKSLDEVAQ